jgi:uncharacterized membrane protein
MNTLSVSYLKRAGYVQIAAGGIVLHKMTPHDARMLAADLIRNAEVVEAKLNEILTKRRRPVETFDPIKLGC